MAHAAAAAAARSARTVFRMLNLLVGLVLLLGVTMPRAVRGRPNFVIIMADDLGYNDLGVTGNPDVETPNLDGLAWESVRFESAYANPICAPTRAQLLTGRHFLRTGVWGVHGTRDYMNLNEVTFANKLKDNGYRTAMFGKWHNGITDGYYPWDRGFEEACMVKLYDYYDNDAICNRQKRWASGWTIERIFDWGMDYIQRKQGEDFLLYLPLMTPHLGKKWDGENEYWHAPENVVNKYRNKGLSDGLSHLYGSIDFMDYNVGRLLQKLDQLGLDKKTVVIFLSDNGPTGNYLMSSNDWWRRNPSGLNGQKGEITDNGIRVPLFIRWRGRFPSASVQKALVSVEDIFPTLMKLSDTGYGDRYLDGRTLTNLLWNPYEIGEGWIWRTLFHVEGPPAWTRAYGVYRLLPNRGNDKSSLHFGSGGKKALRNGRWKYSYVDGGGQYLYDMWNDPSERSPIWDWNKINEMRGWLEHWWNNMLWEPGAFSVPHFYLGWSDLSEIPPMGAVEVSSNLQVKSHNVEGWAGQGTYVLYKIIVLRKGWYNAHIIHWGGFGGKLAVKVFCGGAEGYASGHISYGGFFAKIWVPEFGSEGCILQLSVESGGGWIGFNRLFLTNA